MDREQEALFQKEAFTALLNSPGWHILAKIFDEQITSRTNRVMLVPLGEDGGNKTVEQQEFMKGEAAAFRAVLSLPKTLLANAEAELEDTSDEPEHEYRDSDAGTERE